MQTGKPYFELTYQAKRQFLHYLRHILREITYLPDPIARSFHHAQILHRFRAYRPAKQDSSLPLRSVWQKRVRNEEHLNKLLKDCRDRLAWQYRAANGDLKALEKALFLAYGRIGPRKYKLLHPYIKPDIPQNTEKLKDALSKTKSFKLPLSKALKAIIQEQARQGSSFMSPIDINTRRFLKDVLPKENIWGRPMPLKRLANTKRKMFVELTSKLYPPLPDDEFKRLQDLAAGIIPCPSLPIRRKRLKGLPELPRTTTNHKIKPRTMRRLWSQLIAFCSTIKKNDTTGAYKVYWGRGKYSTVDTPITTSSQIGLFAQTIEPL